MSESHTMGVTRHWQKHELKRINSKDGKNAKRQVCLLAVNQIGSTFQHWLMGGFFHLSLKGQKKFRSVRCAGSQSNTGIKWNYLVYLRWTKCHSKSTWHLSCIHFIFKPRKYFVFKTIIIKDMSCVHNQNSCWCFQLLTVRDCWPICLVQYDWGDTVQWRLPLI